LPELGRARHAGSDEDDHKRSGVAQVRKHFADSIAVTL
jgi:hypothetical protein